MRFSQKLSMALATSLSLAIVTFGGVRPASASPGNLINTSFESFESDANSDGFADGWGPYLNIASADLSSLEFHDGSRSQHLVSSAVVGGGPPRIRYSGGSAPGGTIPVVQGQPYTFAFWFKTSSPVFAIADIKGYNAGGGEQGSQTATYKVGNGSWQRTFVTKTFSDPLQVNASGLAGIDVASGADVFIDSAEFGPDSDSDGVLDVQDSCPGSFAGQNVDAVGCPTQVPALFTFTPGQFGPYVNVPTIEDGHLVLRNTTGVSGGAYVTGVAQSVMPTYLVGDVYQWAVLACSASGASTLNLGVQQGTGQENTLTVKNQIVPGTNKGWSLSKPAVVNIFRDKLYLFVPGALGQRVDLFSLVLGDPASVASYLAAHPATGPCASTPPVISSSVTGTLGLDNWYTSTPAVSWTVADPESPITSSSGCDPATIAETVGTTRTCTAISGGGTSTGTVTVKVDPTAPTISAVATPPANANGWNTSDVTVAFACSDQTSGLAPGSPPTSKTVSAEGSAQLVSGACTDNAGNSASTSVSVSIDKTAPTISIASPAPGFIVARGEAQTVNFTCADLVSGISSCAGSAPDGSPLDTSTLGPKTVTVTATDYAGNTVTRSVGYTVVNPAFASMTSTLKVEDSDENFGEFKASGQFTLSSYSNGINPVSDGLSMQLTGGTRSVSIVVPPGALRADGQKKWKFEGTLSGLKVEIELRSLGGPAYSYSVHGEKAPLRGLSNTVVVRLAVGDDSGAVVVALR